MKSESALFCTCFSISSQRSFPSHPTCRKSPPQLDSVAGESDMFSLAGRKPPACLLVLIMPEVVIISAVRTPVGKFQGSLQSFSAPQLGALVVREAVRRAGVEPASVDDCIMGCVLQAGLGQNPARQAAIFGGLPPEVGALTINKVCGSGLKAVGLAAQAIQTANSTIVVAGGMESMSNAPYLLPQGRKGFRMGDAQVVDSMIRDGLWDV